MLKKIAIDQFSELVKALLEKGPLYAPVKGKDGVNFQAIQNPADVTLDFYNTVLSPKSVFFPQSEDMIRYRITQGATEAHPVPPESRPAVILGVRPCDVRSFEIMDRHFLGAGVVDPYWKSKRDSTTVIGFAFDVNKAADPADFYNSFGYGAADPEGSDVFMIRADGNLLLRGMTDRGKKLLGTLTCLQAGAAQDEKTFEETVKKGKAVQTRSAEINSEGIAKKLVSVFDNGEFWQRATMACIACGACTFVCPTCYCFDISDETLFKEGSRKRFWDACTFTDFTLEASGHNPRPRIFQRYRQKVCHKYSYHVDKYGCISCVGCGRCIRSCPVNIDIFGIVVEAGKL
ncbi:MAG: 4Fe-4S ferredoxin [Deltaproteobacteria bacterium]|nr:4Fe-4S ferredoxin [Deltaproteobacteria bacterium]